MVEIIIPTLTDKGVEASVTTVINFIIVTVFHLCFLPSWLCFLPIVFLPVAMEDDHWPTETSTHTAQGPKENGTLLKHPVS